MISNKYKQDVLRKLKRLQEQVLIPLSNILVKM